MKFDVKLRCVIAAALVCSLGTFVEAGTGVAAREVDGLAPEVSVNDVSRSFRDVPHLDKAFIDLTPSERKDALVVGELGFDGGKKEMIVELAQEIADGKHGRFDSLLIVHKGKLLFESYYLRGRVDLPHPQASATKAYLSMAIGRAIQMGYLTMADLDKPLASFLNDLDSTKFTKGAEKITLHTAMTMSSGLRFSREERDEVLKNGPSRLNGQGQIQTYLEHSPPISGSKQVFDYKFTDPSMVMQVLDAVVPGSARDFIKSELLDKMGITVYGWLDGYSGLPEGSHSSSMTSRSMIKWGTLAINKGMWNGEQLIPEAFVVKATNRIVHPSPDEIFFVNARVSDPGYGYFWWQADLKVGNRSYLSRSAQGGGGQYIILVDELDLLVVTTGHDRELRPLRMTAEKILPAFMN